MAENNPAGLQPGNPKLVIVAVVLALLAVVLVNVYISMVRAADQPGSFTVFRLNVSVKPGETLQQRDVTAVKVDKRFANAFKTAVKANPQGEPFQLGQTFHRAASMNDVLTYDLFEPRSSERLDLTIDPGQRGVALPVNSQKLPGDIQPGMYVDITAPFHNKSGQMTVLPVIERVKVLLVGSQSALNQQNSQDPANTSNYSTITVEVTPKQALELSEIQHMASGEFEINLRNPGDESTPGIPGGGINPELLKRLHSAAATSATG